MQLLFCGVDQQEIALGICTQVDVSNKRWKLHFRTRNFLSVLWCQEILKLGPVKTWHSLGSSLAWTKADMKSSMESQGLSVSHFWAEYSKENKMLRSSHQEVPSQ